MTTARSTTGSPPTGSSPTERSPSCPAPGTSSHPPRSSLPSTSSAGTLSSEERHADLTGRVLEHVFGEEVVRLSGQRGALTAAVIGLDSDPVPVQMRLHAAYL